MKKLIIIFLMILSSSVHAADKLNVVATLPVFASIAQEIGGDRIETHSLAPSNKDPHFLDAKPSYVVKLNRADVLIEGGLELEVGWLPPILMQARNAKIMPSRDGYVDLSIGIQPLEVPTAAGRALGDVHPRGNPHTWTDPRNVKIMAVNIKKSLSLVDPEGDSYYQDRLRTFMGRLNEKIKEWEMKGASLKGKPVVTYHVSFSYFAEWIGLNVVDTIEPRPGIPPSSRRADKLLGKIPSLGVKAIVAEPFYPQKIPQYLSQKSGVTLLVLETDTGMHGIETYFDLMDHLIDELSKVL